MSEESTGGGLALANFNINPEFAIGKRRKGLGAVELRTIDLLNRMVCANQADLMQYIVLGDQLHIALEKVMNRSLVNPGALREAFLALDSNLNRNLDVACHKNFSFLLEYFKGRSVLPPRACIKTPQVTGNGDLVTGIFRSKFVGYNSTYALDQNTGFRVVRDTGESFLENDIPRAAKRTNEKQRYKNPRLNADCAAQYKPLSKRQKRKLKKQFTYVKDESWSKCWRNNPDRDNEDVEVPEDACYKSTLIIPITLLGHAPVLDQQFKEVMELETPSGSPEDKYRVIYGFLCIDHVEDGFFRKEPDTQVGYIFADILSFYFIMRRYLTVNSDIYKAAQKQLD